MFRITNYLPTAVSSSDISNVTGNHHQIILTSLPLKVVSLLFTQ